MDWWKTVIDLLPSLAIAFSLYFAVRREGRDERGELTGDLQAAYERVKKERDESWAREEQWRKWFRGEIEAAVREVVRQVVEKIIAEAVQRMRERFAAEDGG